MPYPFFRVISTQRGFTWRLRGVISSTIERKLSLSFASSSRAECGALTKYNHLQDSAAFIVVVVLVVLRDTTLPSATPRMRRFGSRPRLREPWGKRPNGPARRYVSLFVYAIITIAMIGRLGVWRGSNRNANDSYYKSSADAWALRARTLETVEHVVVNTHPAAIGAAHSTHVHLPTGGYLCAWVAPRSKSEASRPAVWASRRLPIGESSDSSTKWWSDPFVLARAPGTPNTHEKPALFFVHDVLHLHFMVRDAGWEGHGAADAFETVSTDFGDTWSAVVAIETASVDAGATPGLPKVLGSCAVGGSLVRKPLNGEKGGFQVTCLGDFFLNEEKIIL